MDYYVLNFLQRSLCISLMCPIPGKMSFIISYYSVGIDVRTCPTSAVAGLHSHAFSFHQELRKEQT